MNLSRTPRHFRRRGFLSLLGFQLLLIGTFLSHGPAAAEDEQIQLDSATADVTRKQVEKEMEQRAKAPEPEAPAIEPPSEQPPPAPPEGPRFVLREVTLRGNTAMDSSVFEPLISPHRNKEVALQDLHELAAAIQQKYRAAGYVTTLAYVPPQRIDEGRVIIEILEGRLGEVRVEGQRYVRTKQLLRYWRLEPGQVLRYQDLRESLYRITTHPDRKVRALLLPGKEPGTTDVVLKVEESLPVHLISSVNRQGTKAIGQERFGTSLNHNNLTGWDDQLLVGTVGGENFGSAYGQYSFPVGPLGTRLSLTASHAQVSPRRQFKPFGVNGTSETYSVGARHPLISTEKLTLSLNLHADVSESRTKVLSGTSRRDRLRVLRFATNLLSKDSWGAWSTEMEGSFGIKGFGAMGENNPLASRSGADPDFSKLELTITRVQRMPWATYAVFNVTGQTSPSKLTPQEQIALGGATSIRGYPESDYLADQGVVARFDYVVPAHFLPGDWKVPLSRDPLREVLRFNAFIDKGYGYLRAITQNERSTRNPMGIGTGLSLNLKKGLSARFEYGWSLGEKPLTEDERSSYHFQLQYEL